MSTSDHKSALPDEIYLKLIDGDLQEEIDVWLLWMWDSAQPPTVDMAREAVELLKNRKDESNSDLINEFISEIEDYLAPEK